MNRRDTVFALLALGAAPRIASAQQKPEMPVIGFLSSRSPAESAHLVAAFRQGLGEAGYVEGKNIAIEYRWAEGKYERLPGLAADLVDRRVAVISTAGGTVSALAAKAATATIPVVFLSGGDLVKLGLVSNLARPGGNVTGVSQFTTLLAPKRLELLREIKPKIAVVAMLVNLKNPNIELELTNAREAARSLGVKLIVISASNVSELDAGFTTLVRQKVDALSVTADPFLDGRRAQIAALALRHAVPAIYAMRESAVAGGLMSYGPDFADTYRQAGIYTAQILNGAKPGDLPVMQPSTFQFVVNLITAKALGITFPQSVLVRADEVIQ